MDPRERRDRGAFRMTQWLSKDPGGTEAPQTGPTAINTAQGGTETQGPQLDLTRLSQCLTRHSLPSAVEMSCTNLWKTVWSSGLFGYSSFSCHQLSVHWHLLEFVKRAWQFVSQWMWVLLVQWTNVTSFFFFFKVKIISILDFRMPQWTKHSNSARSSWF